MCGDLIAIDTHNGLHIVCMTGSSTGICEDGTPVTVLAGTPAIVDALTVVQSLEKEVLKLGNPR